MQYRIRTRLLAALVIMALVASDTMPAFAQEVTAARQSSPENEAIEAAVTEQEETGFEITDGILTSYVGEAEEIHIPSDVSGVASGAFMKEKCPNLKDVYVDTTDLISIPEDAFDFNVLVWFPDEVLSSYLTVGYTTQLWHAVPQSAVLTDSGCVLSEDGTIMFAYLPARNTVSTDPKMAEIPATVQQIGPRAILDEISGIKFTSNDAPQIIQYYYPRMDAARKEFIVRIPAGSYENYEEVNSKRIGGMLWPEDTVVDEKTGLAVSGDILVSAQEASSNVVVPDDISAIGTFAFAGKELNIKLPATIESIAETAFDDALIYELDITEWEISDFYNVMNESGAGKCIINRFLVSDDQFVLGDTYVLYDAFADSDGDMIIWPESSCVEGDFVIWEREGRDCLISYIGTEEVVTIPEGIEEIYMDAFYYAEDVETIIFPESLEYLWQYSCLGNIKSFVFQNKSAPKMLYLSDSGEVCIAEECSDAIWTSEMQEIQIPEGTYNEYAHAFWYCLPNIVVNDNKPEADEEGFVIREGVLVEYTGEGGNIVIPEGVTAIAPEVFLDNTSITGVKFPKSLRKIGDFAFCQCTELTGDIILPVGVEIIGVYAFKGCASDIGRLYVCGEKIDDYAFQDISARQIIVGEDVNSLDWLNRCNFENMEILMLLQEKLMDANLLSVVSNSLISCDVAVGENILEKYEQLREENKLVERKWPEASYVHYDNGCVVHNDWAELCYYIGEGGKVIVPEGVEYIGTGIFSGRRDITEFVFPATLNGVAYDAFEDMSGVKTLTLQGNMLPYSMTYAISHMQEIPEKIILSDMSVDGYNLAVKELVGQFGKDIKISFEGITADENGMYILQEGNKNCLITVSSKEECVVVPEGITHIASGAFMNCDNLKSVILPSTLEEAGYYVFGGTKAEEITFKSVILPKLWKSENEEAGPASAYGLEGEEKSTEFVLEMLGTKEENWILAGNEWKKITVPEEVVAGYRSRFDGYPDVIVSDGSGNDSVEFMVDGEGELIQYAGSGGDIIIPDTVKVIPEGIFTGMDNITSVTFSEGLKVIKENAFSDCVVLGGTLKIPDTVEQIGENAFYNTAIERIIWGESLEYIGDSAFMNCRELRKIGAFPQKLTTIGGHAFSGTEKLTGRINITDSIVFLGSYAFAYSGIEGVTIGKGMDSLNRYVFYECKDLKGTVVIPDNIICIEGNAFSGCGSLEKVVMSDEITAINDYTFEGCVNLKEIDLPEKLISIGSSAFEDCMSLAKVEFPETLTTIKSWAFNNCKGITGKLVIPDSVTQIGNYAFRDCAGIEELYLGEGITTLGSHAFRNCTTLSLVSFGSKFTKFSNNCMVDNKNLKTYIFRGMTVPEFYDGGAGGSIADPNMSCFPLFDSVSTTVSIYAPQSALNSYRNAFNKVTRMKSFYYDYLALSADNFAVMETENEGTKGVYFTFENPYHIPVTTWEVLVDNSVVATVTNGSYGTFIGDVTVTDNYSLKVYDAEGHSYMFAVTPVVLEGSYGEVTTGYKDNIITDEKDTLSIDVWFESEKAAKNAGTITFYYEDSEGNDVVIAQGILPEDVQEGRKRTYKTEWNVELIEDGTYSVWAEVLGDENQSDITLITIEKDNNIPQVQNFDVSADDSGNVVVSWEHLEEIEDIIPEIKGYRIYRMDESGEEESVAETGLVTEWIDRTVVSGQTIQYRICAVDNHGREGESSNIKTITLQRDTKAPVISANVEDQTHFNSDFFVEYTAEDNRNVSQVQVFVKYPWSKNFILYSSNTWDYAYFSYYVNEEVSQTIQVRVVATDTSGNKETKTYIYYQDFTVPEAVTELRAEAKAAKELKVSWNPSSSDDVVKYYVTCGEDTLEITPQDEMEVVFTGLEYDTDYDISVVAEDQVGYHSERVSITGHTMENPAPIVGLTGPEDGSVCHDIVTYTVTASDDDRLKKVYFDYSYDQVNWKRYSEWSTTGDSFEKTCRVDIELLENYKDSKDLYLRAYAEDSLGKVGAYSISHIVLDYTGPTVSADTIQAEYESPNLNVSFEQSKDEDASHYILYYVRGTSKTELKKFTHDVKNTDKVFTYSHSSAQFGQYNTYAVYAYDKFGNESIVTKELYAYKYEEPAVGKIIAAESPHETILGGIYNTVKTVVTYPDHNKERADEIVKAVYSYLGFDGNVYTVDANVSSTTSGVVIEADIDLDTLQKNTEIILTIKDKAGKTYTQERAFSFVTEQPVPVYGFYVNSSETSIYLNWTVAPEITTTGYRIYRKVNDGDFVLYSEIKNRETKSYIDMSVEEDNLYTYYMTAVSEMGVESDPCISFELKLQADEIAPELNITPATGKTFGRSVRINAKATDNVAVKEIRIYRMDGEDRELIAETQGNSLDYTYIPGEDVAEGPIVICGEAEDGKGNLSKQVTKTYYLDRTGPDKVVNLTYSSTATTAVINWDDVSAADFSYFSLERFDPETKDYKEEKRISNYRGVSLQNLMPDTIYIYRVVAYDLYGNRGIESSPVSVQTAADTTAPVITAITPTARYYNDDFTVKYTAQDDVTIKKFTVQYSVNGVEWTNLQTFEYDNMAKKRTCSYTFKAEEYKDGKFMTRAIAEDEAGNISNQTATAPFTEYGFDRVAPKVPENVQAEITNGYINITWDDNAEADKSGYNVYRSTERDGDYKKLASERRYINYPDTNAVPETTYYYKISVVDKYGNESACSDPVSITMEKDIEIPIVYSISPAAGKVMTDADKSIKVKAADNYQVEKITVEFVINGEPYGEPMTQDGINKTEAIVSFDIPENIQHGDELTIKVKAADIYGNESEVREVAYTFDKEAPEMGEVSCEISKENELDVILNWNCDSEDINGFYIYRKDGLAAYKRVGSQASNEEGRYQWTDATITEGMKSYTYKVTAVDKAGNTSSKVSDSVMIMKEVPVYPQARLSCTTSIQEDTEYIFDATDSTSGIEDGNELTYQIDFGDGTNISTSAYNIHSYKDPGTYTVTLTVTNDRGYSEELTRTIKVYEKAVIGTVEVKVVNENGDTLSGIPVYFDMDHTTDNIQKTKSNGTVTFTATAGTYKVGAYTDGYLPDQSQIVIVAGTTRKVKLILEEEEIVTGTFEVKRMTLSEIKEAGINPADPANQNVVKADVSFTYGKSTVSMKCYHTGEQSWGDSAVIQTESGERKLIAQPVVKKKKTSSDSTSSGTGGSADTDIPEIDTIVILDTPVNASCLKEFFDVKLHIINNATNEFHLINNTVNLHLPDGLSLVETYNSERSTNVSFGSLAGQQQHTISWILRGDKEGSYDLTADYEAVLQEFDADVSATFKTEDPVKVYGLSNLELVIQPYKNLLFNTTYFTLGLRNVGAVDILYPTIDIPDQIIQVTIPGKKEDSKQEGDSTGGDNTEEDSGDYMVATLMEQRVSNEYGFSQVVSEGPELLAAGEMFSKKYAVYGVTSNTDFGNLKDVMVEVAEGFGVKVVVEEVDMDLYDTEDAENKVEEMLNGANRHAYDYLMTNSNFAYYSTYEYSEEDFSDEVKDFADMVFDADFDSVTGYQEEEIIKQMLAEMMVDSSIQVNVQEKIDTTYIDTVKKMLGNVKTTTTILGESGETEIDDFLSDTKAIVQLADALKVNGTSGEFLKASISIAGSAGYQVIQSKLKEGLEETWISAASKELNSQLKDMNDIIGVMSEVATTWNQSAESVNLLMNMQYSYDESMRILNALKQSDDETLKRVAGEMLWKVENHRASMVQEFTTLWAKGLVNKTTSGIQSSLEKVFGDNLAGKVYGWAGVIYSIEDKILGWSETYDAQEKAVIAGKMTEAFLKVMNASEDPTEKLQAFRYVIKMRFIGERVFTELLKIAYEQDGMDADDIEKKVVFWYDNQVLKISKYRDVIYQTEAANIDIPVAPTVTIDYENCKTIENFTDEYEYSFDNEEWITCDGGPIAFEPKSYVSTLYVRVRGNEEHLTGNIRIVALPAIRKMDKEARVQYFEGEYVVKGLEPGQYYQYMLSDTNLESNISSIKWSAKTKADLYGTITFTADEFAYLMIRLPAVDNKIASKPAALMVKKIQQVSAPEANYASGNIYYGKTINLTCATENAIVYYTTDGSTPIPGAAGTKIWTPYTTIEATQSFTLKAMASIPEDEGYRDSEVITYKYTVIKQQVSAPKANYKAGNVYVGKKITLTCTTKNAVIYYTTDGSTPIPGGAKTKIWTSSTSITASKSFTLKAIASVPGDKSYSDSSVVTYKYTVVKYPQKISTGKSSYTYTYKSTTFSLGAKAANKLTYKTSNSKVVTVSSKGKVTIKGYGTAKITITAAASGTYNSAKKTVTVTIKPVKQSISSISDGKKKLTVKWKKDKRASGYQVQRSTSSKFTSSKTKTYKVSKSKTYKSLTGLSKKKKYYVRIRAYTTVGGKTVYGDWSKVKSKKTK